MTQVRTVPQEGLSHPVFEGMSPADHLVVTFGFAQPLDAQRMALARAEMNALEQWPRGNPGEGIWEVFKPFLSEYLMAFRIGNLQQPREAVWNMIGRLHQGGVVFKDGFFCRWAKQWDDLMGPVRDPRAPQERPGYPNPRTYLDDLWNPQVAMPPASEFTMDLKGAFITKNDDMVLEMRGMPLYWPGWRIGYGLHPVNDVPGDQRSQQVLAVLVQKLIDRWQMIFKAPGKEHMRPQPKDRNGEIDAIIKVVCGTRVGYSFAIDSVQLLDWPCPDFCRFREIELFEAILHAVSALGLAPVISWQRFGRPIVGIIKKPEQVVIQLWEMAGEHGSHPGLDHALDGSDEDDDDLDQDDDSDDDDDDDDDDDEDDDDEDDDDDK